MPALTGLPHRGKCAPGGIYQTHFGKPRSSYSTPTTPVQALLGGGTTAAFYEALSAIVQATGIKFIATKKMTPTLPSGAGGFLAPLPACQVGDMVLIHVGVHNSNLNFDTTVSSPGWTLLSGIRIDLTYSFVLYRFIDGTEGSSVVVSFGGSSPSGNTATAQATSYRNVDPANPFQIGVVGDAAAYDAAVLADSPRAYWRTDDASGNFLDSSGNGLTLTAAGSLSYGVAGPGALLATQFTGGGKGSRAQISAVIDNLTMECWVYPTAYTANQTIMANINGGSNGYEMGMTSAGKLQVVCQGVAIIGGAGTTIPANAWTHVAVKRVAGVWKGYINGVLDQASMGVTTPLAPSGATTGLASNVAFSGRLSRGAFYESAVSDARLLVHAQLLYAPPIALATGGDTTPSRTSFTTSLLTTPDPGDLGVLMAMADQNTTFASVLPKDGVSIRYNNNTPAGVASLALMDRQFPYGSYNFSVTFGNAEYAWHFFYLRPKTATPADVSGTMSIDVIQPLAKTKDSTAYNKKVLANNPYFYLPLDEDGTDIYLVAADASVNGRNGRYTATGVTYRVAPLITGGTAVTLDGTSGWISNSFTVPAGNKLMLEAWIKTSQVSGMVFGAYDNQSTRFFQLLNSSGKLQLIIADSGQSAHILTGVTTINDNVLHHVVGTYDGVTMRVYVDGVEDANLPVVFTMQTGSNNVYIGAIWSSLTFSTKFSGTIDGPAMYFNVDGATPGNVKDHFLTATGTLPNVSFESTATIQKVGSQDPAESLVGVVKTTVAPAEASQGVAATGIDPLEGLQPIVATGQTTAESLLPVVKVGASDPAEAGQGVAATKNDPLEAKQGIASTASEPQEANKAIVATESSPAETVVSVSATRTDQIEALQGLVSLATAFVESTSGIPVSNTADFAIDAQQGLAKTAVEAIESLVVVLAAGHPDPLEANKAVAQTIVDPVEATSKIAKLAVDPLETALAIKALVVAALESGKGVASTAGDPLEALAAIRALGTSSAESLVPVTAVGSSDPVEIQQGVSAAVSAVLEALRGLRVTSVDPAESVANVAVSLAVLQVEAGQSVTATVGDPVEALAGLLAEAETAVEATGQVAALVVLPISTAIGFVIGFTSGYVIVAASASGVVVAVAAQEGDQIADAATESDESAAAATTLHSIRAADTSGSDERRTS